jgi:hypothetical protein
MAGSVKSRVDLEKMRGECEKFRDSAASRHATGAVTLVLGGQ